MSNTYYQYIKTQTDRGINPNQKRTVKMELRLTAYCGQGGNSLQLTVNHSSGNDSGLSYITLTEKEQDDLIAGILERRTRISATGCEKSLIQPSID